MRSPLSRSGPRDPAQVMKIIKITWLETWLCMCSNLKKVSGFWGVVDMGWWASDGFITVWKRERDSGRWNLLDPSTTILRGQHMNHMNKNVAPPTIVKLVFTTHRKKKTKTGSEKGASAPRSNSVFFQLGKASSERRHRRRRSVHGWNWWRVWFRLGPILAPNFQT